MRKTQIYALAHLSSNVETIYNWIYPRCLFRQSCGRGFVLATVCTVLACKTVTAGSELLRITKLTHACVYVRKFERLSLIHI